MTEKKRVSLNKILAWLLLAASLVMLFLPWMTLQVEWYGRRYTPRELLGLVADISGTSEAEIERELRDEIEYLADDLAEEGLTLKADSIYDAVLRLLNGRMSPWAAGKTAGTLSRLMAFALTEIDDSAESDEMLAPVEQILLQTLVSRVRQLGAEAVLYRVFTLLLIAAAALAAWCVYREKHFGLYAYGCAALAPVLLNGVAVLRNNGLLESIYNKILAELPYAVAMPEITVRLFHSTAAAALCLGLAVLAILFGRFDLIGLARRVTLRPEQEIGGSPETGTEAGTAESEAESEKVTIETSDLEPMARVADAFPEKREE